MKRMSSLAYHFGVKLRFYPIYRKTKKKLAHAQRVLSRRQRRAKKEGRNLRLAKNYQKQRLVVAKLHDKIRRQREDFLQVLSTALIKNHDLVVAEIGRASCRERV